MDNKTTCKQNFLPVFNSNDDNVLALPFAVGNNTDQPICKAVWAADCTVGKIFAALARYTTSDFKLESSLLFGPNPILLGSMLLLIILWS